jgi:hypothetical protein
MVFPCDGARRWKKNGTAKNEKRARDGEAGAKGWCCDLPLPYDGITRTGSKGLSQRRRHRRSTPNETAQVTGIEDFMQDSPRLDAISVKKFLEIQLKYSPGFP